MHDCGRQAAVWGQAVNPEVFSQPVLRCQPESRRDGVFALEGAELCNTGDRGRIDVRVLTVASASCLSSMVLSPEDIAWPEYALPGVPDEQLDLPLQQHPERAVGTSLADERPTSFHLNFIEMRGQKGKLLLR